MSYTDDETKRLRDERDQRIKEAAIKISAEYDARLKKLAIMKARETKRERERALTHAVLDKLTVFENHFRKGALLGIRSDGPQQIAIPGIGPCHLRLEVVGDIDIFEKYIMLELRARVLRKGHLWSVQEAYIRCPKPLTPDVIMLPQIAQSHYIADCLADLKLSIEKVGKLPRLKWQLV